MPRRHSQKKKVQHEGKKNIAAIYCRVSTTEQGESGLSLENQKEKCEFYCMSKDWEVYKIYREVASAGTIDRPILKELLYDAHERKFDVIVALRLDRMSRVPRDFYNLVEELNKYDISLSTVDNLMDTTTAQGRMLVGVLLQFAAFEREINSERTKAAMHQKVLRGEHRGGVPPLGYDLIEKKLVINQAEARHVKYIFTQYLKGTGTSEISRQLNLKGTRTKSHRTKKGKNMGGKKFNRNHVLNVINNPTYTGKIFFNGELLNGQHEAIIDVQIYNRAQELVAENANVRNLGKSIRGQMLLNGLIKCGFCDRYMTTSSGTGRSKTYYYYTCTKSAHEGSKSCESNRIKKEDIENLTIEIIKKVTSDQTYFNDTMALVNKTSEDDLKEIQSEVNDLNIKRRQLEDKQRNMFHTMIDYDLGDKKVISEEIKNIEDLIKDIERREAELKDEIKDRRANIVDTKELHKIYKNFSDIWNELERTEQRDLAPLIIREVRVKIPKKSNEGEIDVSLWTTIPSQILSKQKIGSTFCKVSLRR